MDISAGFYVYEQVVFFGPKFCSSLGLVVLFCLFLVLESVFFNSNVIAM